MSKFIKLVLLIFISFPFIAQTEDLSHVTLFSSQSARAEFAPGTSGEVTFTLDESNKISISITTDTPTLVSRIKTPSGQTLDPTTIENVGGVFVNGGKSMLYVLPFAGVGEYAVKFDAPANITENTRVVVQVLTDSPLGTNLLVVPNELSQGQTTVLTVPVFDDETPVSGASVKVTLVSDDPLSVPLELTLEDDGGLGDYQASDGLYSITLTPTTPGTYRAIADISGHRANGTAFFRQAGAVVTVFEPLGTFDKTLSNTGIDSNNDGLLDNITISVGVNVQKAGEYRVFMNLKTATGQILQASTGAVLETGNHTIGIVFEAETLRETGEDGTYLIDDITLVYYGENEAPYADWWRNAGQTQTYLLTQFDRPPFSVVDVLSSVGVDTNGDGRFDLLQVSLQVDVLKSGWYEWTQNLYTQQLDLLTFTTGQEYLASGLNTLTFDFDGIAIGNAGVDGPYLLSYLTVLGPASLITDAGKTSAISANQFAGSYNLSGYVYDKTGKPVADATVQMEDGPIVLSDADGYYEFTGLGAGTYTVTVSKTGYTEQSSQVTLDKDTPSASLIVAVKQLNRPVLFAGVQSCTNNGQKVSANHIRVYTPDGQFLREFDSGFDGKGILLTPVDFNADNTVDVAATQLAQDKDSAVRAFDAHGNSPGTLLFDFDKQGIQAVFADLNGDGVEEILIASQAKDTRVYRYHASGTPDTILTLLNKAVAFNLAAADTNGDGSAEILLSLVNESRTDNVYIFNANGQLLNRFTALGDKGRAPGLVVSTIDIDADGQAEIVLANAEKNAGFEITVYSADGTQLSHFSAFPTGNGVPPDLAGCTSYAAQGLLIAAGTGSNGEAEIFTVLNGGREVRVFSTQGALLRSFAVTDESGALSGLSVGNMRE